MRGIRNKANANLKNRQPAWWTITDKKFSAVDFGVIRIPDVDKRKTDSLNLIGVVLEGTKHDRIRRIGTLGGISDEIYCRYKCTMTFLFKILKIINRVVTCKYFYGSEFSLRLEVFVDYDQVPHLTIFSLVQLQQKHRRDHRTNICGIYV